MPAAFSDVAASPLGASVLASLKLAVTDFFKDAFAREATHSLLQEHGPGVLYFVIDAASATCGGGANADGAEDCRAALFRARAMGCSDKGAAFSLALPATSPAFLSADWFAGRADWPHQAAATTTLAVAVDIVCTGAGCAHARSGLRVFATLLPVQETAQDGAANCGGGGGGCCWFVQGDSLCLSEQQFSVTELQQLRERRAQQPAKRQVGLDADTVRACISAVLQTLQQRAAAAASDEAPCPLWFVDVVRFPVAGSADAECTLAEPVPVPAQQFLRAINGQDGDGETVDVSGKTDVPPPLKMLRTAETSQGSCIVVWIRYPTEDATAFTHEYMLVQRQRQQQQQQQQQQPPQEVRASRQRRNSL